MFKPSTKPTPSFEDCFFSSESGELFKGGLHTTGVSIKFSVPLECEEFGVFLLCSCINLYCYYPTAKVQVSFSVTLAPLYNLIRVVSSHPLPQILSKIALCEGLGVQLKW